MYCSNVPKRYAGVGLLGVVGAAMMTAGALSWPNEVYHAVCVGGLSCSGECVITWYSWPVNHPDPNKRSCPSGKACVAFHTFFGAGSSFKACVASSDPSDFCNTGDEQPPFVNACSGEYYFCACRSVTTGDCENNGPPAFRCECRIGQQADGVGTYLARNNCT